MLGPGSCFNAAHGSFSLLSPARHVTPEQLGSRQPTTMRLMVIVLAQQYSLGPPVDRVNLGKPVIAIHIRMRKLMGATPM